MEKKEIVKLQKSKRIKDFLPLMKEYGSSDISDMLCTYSFNVVQETDLSKYGNLSDYEIVICGQIGKAGTSLICNLKRDVLYSKLNNRFVDSGLDMLAFGPDSSDIMLPDTISAITIPVGEGGLYKALFSLWQLAGLGFSIEYSLVPVKQVTIEACEIFDLDPWQLLSGKCSLFITDHPEALKRHFKEQGVICETIGHMLPGKDKLICHRENVSRLNRPGPDEILKIIKDCFIAND